MVDKQMIERDDEVNGYGYMVPIIQSFFVVATT